MESHRSRAGQLAIRNLTLGVALCMGLLWAGQSLAAAAYLARATATLEIVSVTGGDLADLVIDTTVLPPFTDSDTYTEGNAVASASGFSSVLAGDSASLVAGERFDLEAEASGAAAALGYADSFFTAEGSVDVMNNSAADTFTIAFRLTWSVFADASVTLPATEDALAFASIFAQTGTDQLLDETAESDVLFGPFGPQAAAGVLDFSLVLGSGESDYVDLFLDADGFAEALSLPAPAPWALLMAGLCAGLVCRRAAMSARQDS